MHPIAERMKILKEVIEIIYDQCEPSKSSYLCNELEQIMTNGTYEFCDYLDYLKTDWDGGEGEIPLQNLKIGMKTLNRMNVFADSPQFQLKRELVEKIIYRYDREGRDFCRDFKIEWSDAVNGDEYITVKSCFWDWNTITYILDMDTLKFKFAFERHNSVSRSSLKNVMNKNYHPDYIFRKFGSNSFTPENTTREEQDNDELTIDEVIEDLFTKRNFE
jgi:hypothetical protein